MNRNHWKSVVTQFGWLCGRCQAGHLRKTDDAWSEVITTDTEKKREYEPHWESEWDEFRFGGLLRCDNPDCRDPVAVGGTVSHEHIQVGYEQWESTAYYRVASVTPAPSPFAMSDRIPEQVREKIKAAAGLLWADEDAAANKIRQAVECLLDERGVKKYPRQGPRRAIPLHNRIVDFASTNPDAGGPLLATKWIGNAGSHSGGLTRDDVIDALEIMEVVLDEVYVRHRHTLLKRVRAINSKRKPLGSPRRARRS